MAVPAAARQAGRRGQNGRPVAAAGKPTALDGGRRPKLVKRNMGVGGAGGGSRGIMDAGGRVLESASFSPYP